MKTIYHYQNLVCLRTGQPKACELLLREHYGYELKNMLDKPSLFADNLQTLVSAKVDASKQIFNNTPVSAVFVNFTPNQITHPNFREAAKQLSSVVSTTQHICIEITEDLKTDHWELMLDNLALAKKLGLLIGIDDFGMGYSNFSSVLSLTPDVVKLDNQYIRNALQGKEESRAFYRLVEFLQDLNAKVVVEGIECEKGHRLARQSNAELGQGYALHMPKPIDTSAVKAL